MAGATELALRLDQGLRFRLELVALLAVPSGISRERRAAVFELPELGAGLALFLVHEVPLLAEQLRFLVQGVPFLEETLEFDLRLFEFRKGLLPDHQVLQPGRNAAIGGEDRKSVV